MTAPEQVQLLPCPFCGSGDVETRQTLTDGLVACNNCGSRTGLVFLGGCEASDAFKMREVITVWNTRQAGADACIRPNGHAVVRDNNGTTVCSAYEALEDAKDEICELKLRLLGRHTATADALEAMREAQHMASDLLQHIDWLTNGLPAMLENGGLTDEEGLIGAAVDAANSGRASLTRLTAAIAKIEGDTK